MDGGRPGERGGGGTRENFPAEGEFCGSSNPPVTSYLLFRAASAALAKVWKANPSSSHQYTSSLCGVE
jgi:hypothetical protein